MMTVETVPGCINHAKSFGGDIPPCEGGDRPIIEDKEAELDV